MSAALHSFFMAPQMPKGLANFSIYALPTAVTTNPGSGDKVVRGGDMSLWDQVTNLPVLVDQTTVGVNQ